MKKTKTRKTAKSKLCVLLLAALFLVLFLAAENTQLKAGTPAANQYELTIVKYVPAAVSGNTNILQGETQEQYTLQGAEYTLWEVDTSETVPETPAQAREQLVPNSARRALTDANGTAHFTAGRGMYYVEETFSLGVITKDGIAVSGTPVQSIPCAPFLVTLPMPDPSGGEAWVVNVHVAPKIRTLQLDKFVERVGWDEYYPKTKAEGKLRSVSIGDPFQWTIIAPVPVERPETATPGYTLWDQLPPCFVMLPETLKVYWTEENDTSISANKLLSKEDYVGQVTENTLEITLTPTGFAKLESIFAQGEALLVIKYDSYLLPNAPHGISLSGKTWAEHTLDLSQSGSAGSSQTILLQCAVAEQPAVYTGKIEVTKLDKTNNAPLVGGEFGIAASYENALQSEFIATGQTDENGVLVFDGLDYGVPGIAADDIDASKTYWLVETRAPNGYALQSEPFAVDPARIPDIEKDGEYFLARVSVYNNLLGAPHVLSGSTPEISTPATPAPDDTNTPTGDANQSAMYFYLAGVSLLVFVGLLFTKRKHDPTDRPKARGE